MKQAFYQAGVVWLLFASGWFLTRNVPLVTVQEASAETDTATVSAGCTAPTATAFMPDVAYTFSWSAPTVSGAATASCSASVTGTINSDTTSPSCTATADSGGFVTGHIVTPVMKLAGLQCQAVSSSKLEVHGDGSDNTSFNIATGNLADPDTTWVPGDQVDNAISGAKDVLFGASGQVATSNVSDGSDVDGATNGEISFGTTEANGGSEMKVQVDVTGYDPNPSTEMETLTFTFTGS